jgi:O-antigen biosynthesis protein
VPSGPAVAPPDLEGRPVSVLVTREGTRTPGDRGVRRPEVRGKFFYVGEEKLYVRGVTYGTFRPGPDGAEYPPPATVAHDLALMAANGINTVRTYTLPPSWMLDQAQEQGLRVLPGLGAERVVGHLNDGRRAQARAEREVAGRVRSVAGHPALLGYAVGNEIPASTVRWLGRQRVERFIGNLTARVRDEDPDGLVTYVNYPSTEYLDLPFVDFLGVNVFLEDPDRLAAYLARLQNLAGDRPLVMTELGLDSLRNGEESQARSVDQQLRTAFAAGCAGAFVFSWTDEWHRGGEDVHDWAFGMTDRSRGPKPAAAALRQRYAAIPFPREGPWPRISVVVCAYNAEATIEECLEAALRLEYGDFEIVVVDDGSTDATPDLLRRYPVRVVTTANRGLSAARNTGAEVADGEIVAYLDSDAYPDRHWLSYLAHAFTTSGVVAVGGPNIPPPGDGVVAECVARSPGGPAHVLLTDTVAEHVPGCNLAIRATALRAIGGFDPRFRTAGDDVDVCWRLQDHGGRLGFSPGAVVWHHRRNSLRAYWRQQVGYGRAEALLEDKWPERYNAAGHFRWAGRIYDRGLTRHLFDRQRVYHGSWGTAPFQSMYAAGPGTLQSLPLTPEWLLLTAFLVALTALGGLSGAPAVGLTLAALSAAAMALVLAQAVASAARTSFPEAPRGRREAVLRRALTTLLHVLQPLARLSGRVTGGLTLWRGHRVRGAQVPVRRSGWSWSERWIAPEDRLRAIETRLGVLRHGVRRGGDFEHWDLETRDGPLGAARMLLSVEELGGGSQLVRHRRWPVVRRAAVVAMLGCIAVSSAAWLSGAHLLAAVAGGLGLFLALLTLTECAVGTGALADALPAGLDPAGTRAPVREPPRYRERAVAEDPDGPAGFTVLP